MGTPPLELHATTSHDAIVAAIQEDEDLQTCIRESSGHAVLTHPPSRVGLPTETSTASFSVVPRVVDREGDEPAQHTDMAIVEDTQGSPNDAVGVQRMDVESSPDHARHFGAWMEDVRMETLDLGGEDDNVELIHASQLERAEEALETEASAPMDITNARSLIEEERAIRSSTVAPPPDDEVTHL